jgi:hypothetical protein
MTATSEVLGVLARADKRYADRHNLTPAEVGYLETLAAAVNAHISGKQRYRNTALRSVLEAVLLGDFDPAGELVEQAEEAVRIVGQIHMYLLSLNSRSRAAHRPVEGAA